ncbi:MAG: CoA-binding protein [Paracoccaceae bacterium]
MTPPDPTDAEIRDLLARMRVVAVVGASANPERASHAVARVLQRRGIAVIPVNPRHAGETILGEPVVARLDAIPPERGAVDTVDIFRRADQAGTAVDEAIAALAPRGLRTIWMQLGVVDTAAAARARAAGLDVVMDRCPAIEWRRLDGAS